MTFARFHSLFNSRPELPANPVLDFSGSAGLDGAMGALYMLFSSISFTTMAAMIKTLGPDLPLVQLVFLRCLLAAPILFIFIKSNNRPLVVKARKLLILRSLLGMSAMYCFFYALTHMPLADCAFIGKTQPLLIALLAPFFLKEKTPAAAWLAIGTGLSGIALIFQPAMAWSSGAWSAMAAAGLSAGAHMAVRRLNRTDYPLVIVFNFTVLTGCATGLFALPGFTALTARQWLLISGVALFASLGQLFMTRAYRRDRAPAVAAINYVSVALAVIYGYIFWDETPNPMAWLGGGLIVTGGLLLIASRWRAMEPARFDISNPGKNL